MTDDKQVKMSGENFKCYGQLTDEATSEYYAWLKQILTLASGSLTILVALRNQILPDVPKTIYLLQLSWLLFAVSIVLALFALRGHHILLFDAARDLYQSATGQKNKQAGGTTTRDIYTKIGRAVPWVFVAAVVALTLFGIVNLIPATKTTPETQKTQATISALPQ